MKNGIHIILGHTVYVENNRVLHAVAGEGVHYRVLHIYRHVNHIGWIFTTSMNVSSFRTACMRGTVKLA